MTRYTALVLAGRRQGRDPFAEAHGATHRALLPVAGVPMLLRVVRTLRAARSVGSVLVSIDDPALLQDDAELRKLAADGELEIRRSASSPSQSVLEVLESLGPTQPVLVTTADHALLTPEMVDHFASADAGDGDVKVGAVAASLVRADYPDSRRTVLRLRDGSWCGANLFAFETPEARRAAAFWRRAEEFRKRPWRLVLTFGPTTLLLFLTRRLGLEDGLARVSRAIGVRIRAVPLPFSEAAIDVDRPDDLALATEILRARASAGV